MIGIIGFSLGDEAVLDEVVCAILVLYVFNMSVGVNVFCDLMERVICVFGELVYVEVIEIYYWYKKDVFSGIVMRLGEVIVTV